MVQNYQASVSYGHMKEDPSHAVLMLYQGLEMPIPPDPDSFLFGHRNLRTGDMGEAREWLEGMLLGEKGKSAFGDFGLEVRILPDHLEYHMSSPGLHLAEPLTRFFSINT